QCKSSSVFEIPFGSFDTLRPDVSHLVKFNVNPDIHYQFNYKLRRAYDNSILDNFLTTSSSTNCLVSITIKQVLEPTVFTVSGFEDMFDWEVCAITSFGTNLMRPTVINGTYTMKAGSFEISSTVGTTQFLDFTGNWWGQTTGLAALMHDVDVANIDYSGSLTSVNTNTGSTLSNGLPTVSLGNDTTICPEEFVMLDAGNAGSIFTWSTGDSTQSIDSVSTPGIYWVNVDNNCGIVGDSIEIFNHPSPNVTAAGGGDICLGESTQLTASGALSYSWDNGAGVGTSVTVAPVVTTTYIVSGTDSNGCSGTDDVTVKVTALDTSVTRSGNTLTANDTVATYQWISCENMTTVAGATSAAFTPTVSGAYAVIVTVGVCSDTSACRTVTLTGGIDVRSNFGVYVYPNPGDDYFIVEFNQVQKEGVLELRSILGQLIYREKFHSVKTVLTPLPEIAGGIYLLKIHTEEGSATVRYFKQ
ncbi:MAG: T9SS type A sorting domain-containing protein, partial [Bacteroidetes bacterium]|nr:T9SS type A sorting domain-containing protein [Bacteroidota bacterium]